MESSIFQDDLRFAYDVKAYVMFTIDKLVAATAKQVRCSQAPLATCLSDPYDDRFEQSSQTLDLKTRYRFY
jgi:histone deacetylase complex regulatory component SIN3